MKCEDCEVKSVGMLEVVALEVSVLGRWEWLRVAVRGVGDFETLLDLFFLFFFCFQRKVCIAPGIVSRFVLFFQYTNTLLTAQLSSRPRRAQWPVCVVR